MQLRQQPRPLYFRPTRRYIKKRKIQECHSSLEISKKARVIDPFIDYQSAYFIRSRPDLPIVKVETLLQDANGKLHVCHDEDKTPKNMQRILQVHVHTKTQSSILVTEDEYVRPCVPLDKYKTSDTSTDKLQRNYEFVNFIKQYHNPASTHEVVVLDSPSIVTTNFLIASQLFKSHQIHVPNLHPRFRQLAPKSFDRKATHYHSSLYEWLRDLPDDGIQYHFGGDYCCTFEGNQTVKPKADITLLFARRLFPRRGGVMWLTFSMRRKDCEKSSLVTQVIDFVQQVSSDYGYELQWLNPEKYSYNTMVYFFLVSL